jgi:hypothetical protein
MENVGLEVMRRAATVVEKYGMMIGLPLGLFLGMTWFRAIIAINQQFFAGAE